MKNLFFLAFTALSLVSCMDNNAQNKNTSAVKTDQTMEKQSIYQFKVTDLTGKEFDFASLKGKKILVVNTASKCGLTPQYENLQTIYDQYKDKNLVIIGFPANNFASQEPGTSGEIAEFCKQNYGVTFPMMDKISVKGADMAPIYQFLTKKSKNGLEDSEVQWNFQKYLIDENGHLAKVVSPKTLPTDPEIVDWIKA
ncbi:glutathione peroxidase [Flavobacterium antarcticum]|uniref:glutathione peroxidase n=1 Tax=Flavobacterium antarcticum TaxID=271155 RepID=UPI0003B674B1|nr:glutathione peroxidase [Flavobacterium antarcticum]